MLEQALVQARLAVAALVWGAFPLAGSFGIAALALSAAVVQRGAQWRVAVAVVGARLVAALVVVVALGVFEG